MESSVIRKTKKRSKRMLRVRKKLRGTAEHPRLCVLKTNQHIAVQLIDDEASKTLASAGTMMKELRSKKMKKSKEAAKLVGAKIAEIAKEKQISKVIFDRGRHQYHGLIAALADSAREAGLKF
jgi:large subunit ribosomal protein L18